MIGGDGLRWTAIDRRRESGILGRGPVIGFEQVSKARVDLLDLFRSGGIGGGSGAGRPGRSVGHAGVSLRPAEELGLRVGGGLYGRGFDWCAWAVGGEDGLAPLKMGLVLLNEVASLLRGPAELLLENFAELLAVEILFKGPDVLVEASSQLGLRRGGSELTAFSRRP